MRIIDSTWDYAEADTKEFTHCYHAYPAMMIPQVARRLIKEYRGKNTRLVFDPYCGSGTSLVEAKLAGLNSIGTDINPLAVLISTGKVQNYSEPILREIHLNFQKYLEAYDKTLKIDLPEINNLDFWFKKEIQHQLAYIKSYLGTEVPEEYRVFFTIPFSEVIREASYTRNSEFKLYRMEQVKLETFNVNPFELLHKKIRRNMDGLARFNSAINGKIATAEVYKFNTCYGIPENILPDNSVDLVVTSPPYGDSHTTVAYGQFSTLSNQWLDIKDARKIDNTLMGGTVNKDVEELDIRSAKVELEKIKEIDKKRFLEVNAFLYDYYKSIENVSKTVRRNGRACYVVGNRTVKKVNIPLDSITAEFFTQFGFTLEKIAVRRIPNKKMPAVNSPSNKIGDLVTTMNNEFIVVMKKTA